MQRSIITLGSQTNALKAQKLLREHRIRSDLVKHDSSRAGRGCVYSLRVDTRDLPSAVLFLDERNIPYETSPGDRF
ncbi:MAG: DUF3343 domain-containing protein [Clostridia bacterium]|nr:DUF3343 domain-containing protein [Clostridia bacterium]